MANKVYMTGDLHGLFDPVYFFTRRLASDGIEYDRSDTLICLGDFGGNYYLDNRDKAFKAELESLGITYFIIRGNHEKRATVLSQENDLKDWHVEYFFGGPVYVENEFPHIKYALDCPNCYTICGQSTLVLPGAYSIDKEVRLQRGGDWKWFEDEQMTQEEMDLGLDLCDRKDWKVDLVLSHSAPEMFKQYLGYQFGYFNATDNYLSQVEYELNYKAWCFGHFHKDVLLPCSYCGGQPLAMYQNFIDLELFMNGELRYI